MLLSPVLTWVAFFLLFIAFIIIVTFILKQKKVQNYGPWAFVVLISLFGCPILFAYWLTHAYVVESKIAYQSYYAFGESVFKFNNRSSQPIANGSKTIVINNTASPLLFEELHYGSKIIIFGGDTTIPNPVDIPAYSSASVSHDIDYVLMAESPSSIRIKKGGETVSMYWLHVKGSNIVSGNTEAAAPDFVKGVAINFSKAFDKSMNDEIVTMEGYLMLPEYLYQSPGSIGLNFYERENQFFAAHQMNVSIVTGEGNNAMQPLPKNYKAEDVKIRANDGGLINPGDRVRVTGLLHASATYYDLDCKKLEKIAGIHTDYTKLDPVKLDATNMKEASLTGQLVTIEGILDVPVFLMGSLAADFELKTPAIAKTIPVAIAYGKGPGRLKKLPDNFSAADIKIHDDHNRLVNINRKVVIYGMWDGRTIKAENISNL